jgi:hypothetical protein
MVEGAGFTVRTPERTEERPPVGGSAPRSVLFDLRTDIKFDLRHARPRHMDRSGISFVYIFDLNHLSPS